MNLFGPCCGHLLRKGHACRVCMRISTVTHHASRLLLEMALHADQGPLSLDNLADLTGMPHDSLKEILSTLLETGFLTSDVASQYRLARKPEEITLGQVVRVIDGGIRLGHCRSKEERCPECQKCKTKEAWKGVIEVIERELDSITFAELMGQPSPAVPL